MKKKALDQPILPLGPYSQSKYIDERILYSGTTKLWLESYLCMGEFKFIPQVMLTKNLFYALEIAEEEWELMKRKKMFEPLLLIVDVQKLSDKVILKGEKEFEYKHGRKGDYYVKKLDIGSFLIEKTNFLTPILLEPYKMLRKGKDPRIERFLDSAIDGNLSLFKCEIESNLIYKSKEVVKRTTLKSNILCEIVKSLPSRMYLKYETACLEAEL